MGVAEFSRVSHSARFPSMEQVASTWASNGDHCNPVMMASCVRCQTAVHASLAAAAPAPLPAVVAAGDALLNGVFAVACDT